MDINISGARFAYQLLKDALQFTSSLIDLDQEDVQTSFVRHLAQIDAWSSNIQMMGMATAANTDHATLALRISSQPRKFSSTTSLEYYSEDDIFASQEHTIILGDPGSGKTTTIKRMVRQILHEGSSIFDEHLDFPLLVIAREIPKDVSLTEYICNIIGARFDNTTLKDYKENELRRIRRETLRDFVFDFCEQKSPLIVIDGIDEVNTQLRVSIEHELASLSRLMRGGQIICTCRSGDFASVIEGFKICEISPLDDDQIKEIVGLWSRNPKKFIEEVASKTYADLLNRPLFLCHIILAFNAFENLPDRPSEVYRRVVVLMLERWDRERLINRPSRYSSFSVEQKIDFIGLLAHNLTYQKQLTSFSEQDLISIYHRMFRRFSLPEHDGLNVIREIESHSGLLVEGAFGKYEFSHLTVQEYLCAHHLVMQPDIKKVLNCFRLNPAPVAIATCLSSDSSAYLANFIFKINSASNSEDYIDNLIIFFNRLQNEEPYFEESADLGAAILCSFNLLETVQLSVHQDRLLEQFIDYCNSETIKSSIYASLHFYTIMNRHDVEKYLYAKMAPRNNTPHFPEKIQLSGRLIGKLHAISTKL